MLKLNKLAPGALYSIKLFQKKGHIRSLYGMYMLFALLLIWDSIYLIAFPPAVMAVWTIFVCAGVFVIKHTIDKHSTGLLSFYLILAFIWWSATIFGTGGWESPIFYFAGIPLILYALSGSLLLNTAGALIYGNTVLFSGIFLFPKSGDFILPLSIIGVNVLTIAGGFLISYALHHYEKTFSNLKEKVYTDYLTGLYNREGFLKAWGSKGPKRGIFAVIDLNQFKQINDNLGHHTGDEVLQRVGSGLKRELPDSAIVGRIGGDEFILYLPYAVNLEAEQQKVETIVAQAGETLGIALTTSVGMLFVSPKNRSFRELYKTADENMYHHKKASRPDLKEMV